VSLSAAAILAAVVSHAQASGKAERVLAHEPKSAPGNGITVAIWVQNLRPASTSGLDATTVRLELSARAYLSMLADPQDLIDVQLLGVVDAFMEALSGDFTLGGLVRQVDLLGEHGDPLSMDAGYLEQDGKLFRHMTITLPLIVDLWSQAP
jgi:hypothetical protein